MTQDDRTPHIPPRHAARFGFPFPPLAGADGEDETPDPNAGEGTPTPEAQLGVEPPALPFSYDDIPDTLSKADAQVWLKAREGQMQSGFTKAVNEAIEARKRAESALTVQQRLENEESRQQAIAELLEPYGLEIEWPDAAVEGTPEGELPEVDDTELEASSDPELDELRERQDRIEERFKRDDDRTAEQTWVDHVTSGLEAFAEREKIEPKEGLSRAESIPKPVRDAILAHAMMAERTPEGQLDVVAGVSAWDQSVEEVARATRAGYVVSKDTPAITLGGGAADAHVDRSTQAARLALANKIAQRHGHN